MDKKVIVTLCKIIFFVIIFMGLISHVLGQIPEDFKIKIGVKKRPKECYRKSAKGDLLHVHYSVSEYLSFVSINQPIKGGVIFANYINKYSWTEHTASSNLN